MRLFRTSVALGIGACCAACSLFVGLDGLNDGDSNDRSALGDAAFSDVTTPADGATASDGSVDFDSGSPFDCNAIDATFCDDFNRDAALGTFVWRGEQIDPACHLSVNGTLVTNADAVPNHGECFLFSNDGLKGRHLSLEFDINLSTNPDSPSVVIAEVDNDLDAPNASGVQSGFFQMLADGSGKTKIGFLEFYPNPDASPTKGDSFPFWGITGDNAPFIVPGAPCHVTLDIDPIASTAIATAACEGHALATLTYMDAGAPAGFIATPHVLLGYDNTGVTAPAWNVAYDNMVFRSTP